MANVSRRSLLALGGAGLVGAAVGGATVAAFVGAAHRHCRARALRPARASTTGESGKPPFFIGHRGVGDMAPEHTLPSYQMALDQGAKAVEISVVMSADNVLYCLHDLTLDRTTTLRGAVRQPDRERAGQGAGHGPSARTALGGRQHARHPAPVGCARGHRSHMPSSASSRRMTAPTRG